MVKPRWTGREEHQLRRLANAGLSSFQIAREMGRTRLSIVQKVYKLKIRIRHTKACKLTEEQKVYLREWCKQRDALGTVRSKAAELRVSTDTVSKWMREERL